MRMLLIIFPALTLLSAICGGCAWPSKSKPAILSGGDFFPDGCTVEGRAQFNPDQAVRAFRVPVYVIPADTLEAMLSE